MELQNDLLQLEKHVRENYGSGGGDDVDHRSRYGHCTTTLRKWKKNASPINSRIFQAKTQRTLLQLFSKTVHNILPGYLSILCEKSNSSNIRVSLTKPGRISGGMVDKNRQGGRKGAAHLILSNLDIHINVVEPVVTSEANCPRPQALGCTLDIPDDARYDSSTYSTYSSLSNKRHVSFINFWQFGPPYLPYLIGIIYSFWVSWS